MDLYRQSQAVRKFELRHECRALDALFQPGVVVVQPDLPHRDALSLPAKARKFVKRLLPEALRFRRMHARREVRAFMALAEFRVPCAVGEGIARQHDARNARRANALPFCGEGVALVREMGVNVDVHISGCLRRSPPPVRA